jgi:hypothetical protein
MPTNSFFKRRKHALQRGSLERKKGDADSICRVCENRQGKGRKASGYKRVFPVSNDHEKGSVHFGKQF